MINEGITVPGSKFVENDKVDSTNNAVYLQPCESQGREPIGLNKKSSSQI